MAKADAADAERIKAMASEYRERIREAGGPLAYCINYINHVVELKADRREEIVIRERNAKYPKMAVQMAAASAIISADRDGSDANTKADAAKWAKAAWVHAAGHYLGSSSPQDSSELVENADPRSMAMILKGVQSRKAKAAEQWEKVDHSDPESLLMLALFGREKTKALSTRDKIIGFGSLAAIVMAVAAYGASNWYLSVKITAPYESNEGIIQHRDATNRVLDYEDFMSGDGSGSRRARRGGGIVRLFLDWPMSPTNKEKEAFERFAGDIIGWRKTLISESMICGKEDIDTDSLKEVIKKVGISIDTVQKDIGGNFNRADSLIIGTLMKLYQC